MEGQGDLEGATERQSKKGERERKGFLSELSTQTL